MNSATTILLHPRPYAKHSGTLLLLPLLPQPRLLKPIPAEIWTEILAFAFGGGSNVGESKSWSWSFIRVCKTFCDISLPLLYSSVHISRLSTLAKFHHRLHTADQKWDSIRRIPYSSPGRWVQQLDLTKLDYEGQAMAVLLDDILTKLFPLTPFLSTLSINPAFILSRRSISSLAQREGALNLRSISGLSYVSPPMPIPDEDPFVQLLRNCPNLEVLVITGQILNPVESDWDFDTNDLPSMTNFQPLYLPNLRVITLLSMHSSPLMLALLNSPLPSLRKLTVTPYDDIPYPASLVTTLISTHGINLASLLLYTPKSWPTRLHPSPDNILTLAPHLNHLSLETPLPSLVLAEKHSLQILSIPRPKSEFWRVLARILPFLPNLAVVRARDVRWLRKGISNVAQEAGVQGEMREWKRRLDRHKILLLDADWREHE